MARWLEARVPVPLAVAAWVEALAKAHKALPPPRLNQPDASTHTAPTAPVVVQAFAGTNCSQQHGIVLQSPYPRRHALAGTTGLRPGAMGVHPKGGSDHEPRPL
ncbi:hypothetical protein [Mesorhizobium montanum]|uniref:hypothetical protein n=1 Tax=Mesorhizobium montanum TaxID=3072323 RepID=UPI002A23D9F7|nr:hypothetical protein [Mesorhizobium sp. MSK_1335]